MNLKKNDALRRGKQIFDFSVGDPDLLPPHQVKDILIESLELRNIFSYPEIYGEKAFILQIQDWFHKMYSVTLSMESEILPLLGVKEGITHLALGMLEVGDLAGYVTPSYPIYEQAIRLAKATPIQIDSSADYGYLPDLFQVEQAAIKGMKLLYLNYPHNPTGAVLTKGYCKVILELAQKYNFKICLDCVYSRIDPFQQYDHFSILSMPEAISHCIEFYSFSKNYNLPGIRLGFAAGNAEMITSLKRVKTNVDVSAFKMVQYLCGALLELEYSGDLEDYFRQNNSIYKNRIRVVQKVLNETGCTTFPSSATFYVWFRTPNSYDDQQFSENLYERHGVLIVPGSEFGSGAQGWLRISATQPEVVLSQGIEAIRDMIKVRKGS